MPRLKIKLPEKWDFATEIPVRITDINYGNHLGNDSLVSILHEARVRWLQQFGWTEFLGGTTGLIMTDLAVRYRSEAMYGDALRVQLAISEWTVAGFDMVYRVTKIASGEEVARAKTGLIFYDYSAHHIAPAPPEFLAKAGPDQTAL